MSKEESKKILLEKQSNKCFVCGFDLLSNKRPDTISFIQIDKSRPKTLENTVLTCCWCAGRQANFSNLNDYIEFFNLPEKIELTSDEQIRQRRMKSSFFRKQFKKYANQNQCPKLINLYQHPNKIDKFSFRELDELALKIVIEMKASASYTEELRKKYPRKNTTKRIIIQKDFKPNELPTYIRYVKDLKRYLGACQAHRCAYCLVELEYFPILENYSMIKAFPQQFLPSELVSRTATFEHVIDRAKGGLNSLDNLIIACNACNSHRSSLNISAEEYYEYVQKNGSYHDKFIKKIKNKRKMMGLE